MFRIRVRLYVRRQSQEPQLCGAGPLWQASLCGSVGRGARALCATLHRCQKLHVWASTLASSLSPTYPHLPSTQTSAPSCRPLDACLLRFFSYRFFFLSECVFVRGWRCPLCHLQQPTPTPPPLISHSSHLSPGWA